MVWVFAGIFLAFLALFIAWTLVWSIRNRGQLRALGNSRPAMSEHHFVALLLKRGVADDVSRMLYSKAAFYYDGLATPYPDDCPLEPPHSIDGDDLSEICVDIWKKLSLHKDEAPMRLDANTWSEIAGVLDQERSRIITHESR
jgi:hypothetical protein